MLTLAFEGGWGAGEVLKKCVILILLFFYCFYFLMTKALAKPNQHLVKDKHLLEKLGRDQNSGPHFCRQTRTQRSKKLKKSKVKTKFFSNKIDRIIRITF